MNELLHVTWMNLTYKILRQKQTTKAYRLWFKMNLWC